MKKYTKYFLVLAAGSMFALVSCGGDSPAIDTPVVDTAAVVDTVTVHVDPPEDKSKRPSPPAKATGTIDGVTVWVDYSQPSVKGRTIWGDLVPYDLVWRTGANEATWIEFDQPVLLNGQPVEEGKYGLFTIPTADGDWTLILNKVWDLWGAYDYSESDDVLRVLVTPMPQQETVEKLTFTVTDKVNFAWENMAFSFTIEAANK